VLSADLIEYAAAGKRALVLGHRRDEILQQISASLHALAVDHGIIAPDYPDR
jgi:hypothetical protein